MSIDKGEHMKSVRSFAYTSNVTQIEHECNWIRAQDKTIEEPSEKLSKSHAFKNGNQYVCMHSIHAIQIDWNETELNCSIDKTLNLYASDALAIILGKTIFLALHSVDVVCWESFLISLTPGNTCQSQIHNLFKLYSKKKRIENTNKHVLDMSDVTFTSCGWWV